ncbi:MAG: hybrid sensor histidine kinase/response regulator [Chloroflexi bacterium]|nr:MAG: hybrid sensor histidine kinase/response regulator [Chloroflexota bacterium]
MRPETIHILLIEDNPGDARLIQEMLQEEFAVSSPLFSISTAQRLAEAKTYLQQHQPDVILLDLSLPDAHGLQTLLEIQTAVFNIPIIVLTGLDNTQLAVEAMQKGAQDYLIKNKIDTEILVRAIRYAIERQRLITELTRKAQELEIRNTELDAFGHTVAHQVQGLLGQILGYASYLEMHYKKHLEQEPRTVLQRIMESSTKMNNVLTELLLMSTISQDEVIQLPLDMGRIVNEACKRLNYLINRYNAKIIKPAQWPQSVGYEPWIEEVWINYISNGLKYGGHPPELELGAEVLPNGMVRYWVQDNGQGIPEEHIKKLFRPHTRLHNRRIKGEGLGLSIVWRIITKCGGEVGVESQPGQGSRFWFTLPASTVLTKSAD